MPASIPTTTSVKQHVDGDALETIDVSGAQLFQFNIGQDRLINLQHAAVFGARLQEMLRAGPKY